MEFSEDEWTVFAGTPTSSTWFLSSPFSAEAVALLARVGVAAWRLASGEAATRSCWSCTPRSTSP